jgi:hypothetical protein
MLSQSAQIAVLLGLVIVLVLQTFALSKRLDEAHKKIDLALKNFIGLRNYLYEIDPQFDDERQSNADTDDFDSNPMAAVDDMNLIDSKEAAGRRTLHTPFAS